MPKSQLTRLLDELCATPQDDPNFLQIAGKVQQAYAAKSLKPKAIRKRKIKVCSDCGSNQIDSKDVEMGENPPQPPKPSVQLNVEGKEGYGHPRSKICLV